MHSDPKDLYEIKEPSKCLSFLRLLWKFCRCIFSHVTLVSLVVAYCVLGAYAFESLESGHEIQVKESIKYVRSNMTKKIWKITEESDVLRQENWTDRVVNLLVDFEAELLDKMKKDGWNGSEEIKDRQWTFAGALFYSIIVITTIGYGHITPKTHNGKVVTIFYAILGIPLMLLCFSNIGKVMASSFRFLYWKICCYVCTRPPKPPRRHHRHRYHSAFVRSQSLRQPGRYASGRSAATLMPPGGTFRRAMRPVHHPQRSLDSALPPSSSTATIVSDNLIRSTRSETNPQFSNGRIGRASIRCDDPSDYRYPMSRPSSETNESLILKHRPDSGSASAKTIIKGGQNNKYSPTATRSLDRKCRPVQLITSSNNDEPIRTPVLFNKYAIDDGPDFNEQTTTHSHRFLSPAMSSCMRDKSRARRCRSVEASIDLEMLRRYPNYNKIPSSGGSNGRSWNKRGGGEDTSSIGMAVPRQIYHENFNLEYDYLPSVALPIDTSEPEDSTATKPVPIWLCVFLVVSYILGGAFLFAEWESWPYLDSAYFCFITLTTIGFGDLVPAHRLYAHQGIALCSLYLLFGIALLVMSFNLVQEEVVNSVKSVAKKLGIIKNNEDDADDIDDLEIDDDYESDEYPPLDRRRVATSINNISRPCNSEFERSERISGFSGDSNIILARRDLYHQHRDRSPMPSRFSSR